MKLKAVLREREDDRTYTDWVYTEHNGLLNLTVFMYGYDADEDCDTVSCSAYRFKSREAGNIHFKRFLERGCFRLDLSNRQEEIPSILDDVRDVIRHVLCYPITREYFVNHR